MAEQFAFGDEDESTKAIAMLLLLLKGWNFKDKEGNVPDITEANIKRLDMITINQMMTAITPSLEMDGEKNEEPEKSSEGESR